MAINRIPGIYDYLGQGIQQFSEARAAKNQRDLIAKYKNLELLQGLYNSGGLDADSFSAALAQSGIPGLSGMQVRPSPAQQKQDYIKSLPPDAQADARAQAVGITPPVDVATRRRTEAAGATSAEAGAKSATVNAETTAQTAPQVRAKVALDLGDAQAKAYDDLGKRYIGSIVAAGGGRVDGAQAKQIVDAAFNKYLQDRQTSKVGVLADPTIVRAHFENALQDLMMEQRKQDIQMAAAQNRGGMSEQDRTLATLVRLQDNVASNAQDLLRQLNLTNKYAQPDIYNQLLEQYNTEIAKSVRIGKALTTLLPADVQDAINAVQGNRTPPPGAATPPPSAGSSAGQTPAGTQPVAPRGQTKPPPAAAPAAQPQTDPAIYQSRMTMLKQMAPELQVQFIDSGIRRKIITPEEGARMKKELGIK